MINSVVKGAGQYKDLAQIGITVNTDGNVNSGATLNFDLSTFQTAFATDPNAVQDLFSTATIGLGNVINNANDLAHRPGDGLVGEPRATRSIPRSEQQQRPG